MSKVDIVRASFGAYEDGAFDAMLEMMHPDLEVQDWPEGPDSRIYRGMDGLMQARAHWAEAWESMRGEPTVQYFTDREAALAAAGMTEEQIRQEAT